MGSLHAIIPNLDLEILAVRLPALEGQGAAQTLVGRHSIVVGDLNTDPDRRGPNGGVRIRALVE